MRFFINFLPMLNSKTYILLLIFFSFCAQLAAQSPVMREDSHTCLKCHSQQTYTLYNDWTMREERRLMNPYHVIDTMMYLTGVHKNFSCIDCHSMDYETYPHDRELKLEPMATCLDCHGGDPHYEQFQFERIDEEFQKSVHYSKSGDLFTCSKCHNQHYYRTTARTSSNVSDIVAADNQMCLSCHSNSARFSLAATEDFPIINDVHSWLPNHELHWRSVRCIDCHTAFDEGLMIAHNILPKEEAVKNCAECHSANSMLQATLYRYENIQSRQGKGIFSSFQTNQAYIIGANQIPLFKYLSVAILVIMLAGITVHIAFRIIHKK
jgi:nitrate/TMAO reductase-like tetraheme cytochrome c subunit